MTFRDERSAVMARLMKKVEKTGRDYALFAPLDKIMVCMSGGKDSYTMLFLLRELQRRLPFDIELLAVHLDQHQPGYDGTPVVDYLRSQEIPFEILSEDTYSIVMDHVEEGQTLCSLCSRLRRGVLYTAAERLGCNKLALGHHREDSLETFLLNLFYAGKLQAMPARYTSDDGRFDVIRPMIECAEDDIRRLAAFEAFPVIPCNLCGSQPDGKRDKMGELMTQLGASHPNLKNVMLHALKNVRPTHLLDRDVLEAWKHRPADVRPHEPATKRVQHFVAKPTLRVL